MTLKTEALLPRLLQPARDLCAETGELSAKEGEPQLWYNRGHADGMVCRHGFEVGERETIEVPGEKNR